MRRATIAVALALLFAAAFARHEVTYPGTVLAIEAQRLQVKTVDPDSKKPLTLWFAITKDTKVKRGDRLVSYAEARIQKDERVVVLVNHEDVGTETPAKELRLAAR